MQFVYINGLFLSSYGDFIRLQTPIENLLNTYNSEKISNYNQHLNKASIKSQHIQSILAAIVALFFNILAIIELFKKQKA